MLALPGGAYVYQGDELGLPDVEDIPDDLRQDPLWHRSGRTIRGRDGCRVPLPWSGERPPFGFAPDGARTWLPQPAGWGSADGRESRRPTPDRCSRCTGPRSGCGGTSRASTTTPSPGTRRPPTSSTSTRGRGLRCVVNLGAAAVPLPPDADVLLASVPLDGAALPPDAAVWLRAAAP